MIVRSIRVFVKQDRVEDFIRVSTKNHEKSIQEPGILRFDCLQSTSDSRQFVLFEVYKEDAAIAAHKETAHYKEWSQAVESMMTRPREREVFTVIAPADQSKW